jgi:membrane-associated phospholipid phosphatase
VKDYWHYIENALVSRTTLLKLFVAALCFWIPVVIFAKIADEVRDKENIFIDSAFLTWLHQFANPTLDTIMVTITNLGSAEAIVAYAFLGVAALLYKRHRRDATLLLFGVGGAAAINLLLKASFTRTRPELWTSIVTEHSFSFPSGHAMASSALAFSVIAIFWSTRYRWLAVGIMIPYMILVGLSRLYLGVHYPSDVIGGWCVSFAWVLIVTIIVRRLKLTTITDKLKK